MRTASSRIGPGEILDRGDDPFVRAAAAQVPAHPLPDLSLRRLARGNLNCLGHRARHAALVLGQHPERRADLARGAIAALEPIMLDEGALKRMGLAVGLETLDGGNAASRVLDRERETGQDALAIRQHGARPTCSLVAAL